MTRLLTPSLTAFFLLISLTLSAQKVIRVVTTQQIEASSEEAFQVLRNFERFPEWSPFVVADPEQKHHVTGETGQIGSAFHWEGVIEKSEGQQTLVALRGTEYLRMECDITKPFKDQPTFEYHITETSDGIEITQTFELTCSGFSRFMMRLLGVEKQIAATNALGLARLKTLLESENQVAVSK